MSNGGFGVGLLSDITLLPDAIKVGMGKKSGVGGIPFGPDYESKGTSWCRVGWGSLLPKFDRYTRTRYTHTLDSGVHRKWVDLRLVVNIQVLVSLGSLTQTNKCFHPLY